MAALRVNGYATQTLQDTPTFPKLDFAGRSRVRVTRPLRLLQVTRSKRLLSGRLLTVHAHASLRQLVGLTGAGFPALFRALCGVRFAYATFPAAAALEPVSQRRGLECDGRARNADDPPLCVVNKGLGTATSSVSAARRSLFCLTDE
ncbi:hypothetical protein SKAU_G00206970 [Synaphobranchus kaupii]|uniref:Uncharacterized protein n=1 Tax=Synaphobranchus kaupii TaxID=118154 RepID=A0A9Q1ISI7_SYNKA|nr:hypothetical protein SKAU_G00206970 [Synaphobranchus kaupii]